jgi:hypothetical protein
MFCRCDKLCHTYISDSPRIRTLFGGLNIKQRLGEILFRQHNLSHIMCQLSYEQQGRSEHFRCYWRSHIICATFSYNIFVTQ